MLRVVSLLLLAVAVAVAAGCGGDDGGNGAQPPAGTAPEPPSVEPVEPAETEPPETAAQADPTLVRVYLVRGEKIGVGARSVDPPAVARAALEAVLAGPDDSEREAGLTSAIPEGTELLGVSVDDDGHAVVDLSPEFEAGGGSLSMQARVAQVVYTLTQFPTVERVSIRLGGQEVEAIGGEGVPAADLTRADFEDLTPAILLESPTPGDRIASPLRIQGTANTFEANFLVELEGSDGSMLVDTFVTATSGSGERGTFDTTFRFEGVEPGIGTLRVFEESAADGSVQNLVEIPVELMP